MILMQYICNYFVALQHITVGEVLLVKRISIADKLHVCYCYIIDTPLVNPHMINLEFFRRVFFHHQQNLP